MNLLVDNTTVIGNLGEDAVLETVTRTDGKKKQVLKFRFAVNLNWKNAQGELQKKTKWYEVEKWYPEGKNVNTDYLRKGTRLTVTGQVEPTGFVGKDDGKLILGLALKADNWVYHAMAKDAAEERQG